MIFHLVINNVYKKIKSFSIRTYTSHLQQRSAVTIKLVTEHPSNVSSTNDNQTDHEINNNITILHNMLPLKILPLNQRTNSLLE